MTFLLNRIQNKTLKMVFVKVLRLTNGGMFMAEILGPIIPLEIFLIKKYPPTTKTVLHLNKSINHAPVFLFFDKAKKKNKKKRKTLRMRKLRRCHLNVGSKELISKKFYIFFSFVRQYFCFY